MNRNAFHSYQLLSECKGKRGSTGSLEFEKNKEVGRATWAMLKTLPEREKGK